MDVAHQVLDLAQGHLGVDVVAMIAAGLRGGPRRLRLTARRRPGKAVGGMKRQGPTFSPPRLRPRDVMDPRPAPACRNCSRFAPSSAARPCCPSSTRRGRRSSSP